MHPTCTFKLDRPRASRGPARRQASALLIVFWAIAVMSICVLGLVAYLHSDMDETTALKKDSRARQLAEAGVAVGMHPLAIRADPVLHQVIAPGEEFEVRLRSEGGRLNINNVIQGKLWPVLQNLFSEWGMGQADIDEVLQGFRARWTTVETPQINSPPGQYPFQPVGVAQLFQSVDEMAAVPGMDLVAQAKPDWREYFTIWSDGPLDLNDAPADLIAAVCGVGTEQAEQFVNYRLGPDGKPDTEDDVIFTNFDQVRAQLGMSTQQFAAIQNLVSLQDSHVRIESTGTFHGYRRKISVVARKNAVPPQFFLWQET